MSQLAALSSSQETKLTELKSSYGLLFLTNISLHHSYIIVLGFMTSAFIVMVIILTGVVEVYRPLQRLKAFTR